MQPEASKLPDSQTEQENIDAAVIWQSVYDTLSRSIPANFFNIFFDSVKAKKYDGNQLLLSVENDKIVNHLRNRYLDKIEEAASHTAGKSVKIALLHEPGQVEPARESLTAAAPSDLDKISINPKYTFDRFIRGPSNEHAYAAALSAAENPSDYHNPLYIYGNVGVGKTHLMMAIANQLIANKPSYHVKYSPAETFQNELYDAIARKSVNSLKARYRNIDVLLFDDIQFIAERANYIQEEIFHLFNFLYQQKKQIVISGDRPPQQLATLHDRLQSRFQSGLIVDIKAPNFETRLAILQRKASEMNLSVPMEVHKYLAARFTQHVRILEAALIKLQFTSQLEKHPIDLQMTKIALRDMPSETIGQQVSIDEILRVVSRTFHVNEDEIKGSSRVENIVLARHACMYLAKNLIPTMSLKGIAEAFGKTDHTTVMHAEKKMMELMDKDNSLRVQIEELSNELKF